MKTLNLIHLKNEMLVANGIANFIGVFLVNTMIFRTQEPFPKELLEIPIIHWTDVLFDPFAFSFVLIMTLIYEQPIRRYLNALFKGKSIHQDLQFKARQRLLNEPFVLIALDLSMWILAAIVWTMIYWAYDSGSQLVQRVLCSSLGTGLITVTVAFFMLEHLLQKQMAPHFFPNGGLSAVPKTLRIRIRIRLMALLFACNLIPLISVILIMNRIWVSQDEPTVALANLKSAIIPNALIFIGVGICLTMLVSHNLSIPFRDIIQTLRRIRNGHFDKRVRVISNDEIGFTGDAINEMAEGLVERNRLQQALNLAKEVQQNLLPKSNLQINGFEIAGKSVYCDETGGDYYDFFTFGDGTKEKVVIVIGDVSGHGIPSALLMATVRSSIRQRAFLPGSTAKIITDVNRQLTADVEDSGQFITMFFLVLNTKSKRFEWVRAGHDAALLYDINTDTFNQLSGPGIALGVDSKYVYEDNEKTGFSNGQIIFLSTDGVWEARNKNGKMLGKEPIWETIRNHSSSDAMTILDAVFGTVQKFIGMSKIEDDITAVVIKAQNSLKL